MIKIGSLNVRGINQDLKQKMVATDFKDYNLDILLVQETHIKQNCNIELRNFNNDRYILNNSGRTSFCGVGFIVNKNINYDFFPVNDRMCYITCYLNNTKINIINVYAPTETSCEKNPSLRLDFYIKLHGLLNKFRSYENTIVGGDFNAKTGDSFNKFSEIMGKFGKGKTNKNGQNLLELAYKHNFLLTNTLFEHKYCHRATWENPKNLNKNIHQSNQIDYILINKKYRSRIIDSRSYGGRFTYTDHKLVICKFKCKPYYTKNTDVIRKMKVDKTIFDNKDTVNVFKENINSEINQIKDKEVTWQDLSEIIKQNSIKLSENIKLNNSNKKFKSNNKEIIKLSNMQKQLGLDASSATDEDVVKAANIERNKIMKQIKVLLKSEIEEKEEKIISKLEESAKNPNLTFNIIKEIYKNKSKEDLYLIEDNKMIINQDKVTKKITEHFSNMFFNDQINFFEKSSNVEMRNPFNKEEIKSAVKKLNNNKSAGPDDIFAEELKNCPDIVFDLIANMFNKVANNGESLKELNEGFLVPLLKPGKAKGSVENLRPIILFNIIRKILCNVILNRIRLRLEKVIPISQAAYRKGRSTTENVCAMKLLIDKALIEKNFSLDLLLLDMSKAFDSVNRENLMSDLRNILESDELNIINLLINEVKLKVKNKDNIGNFFDTNIGVPQGDSLSPILFTLYLANTLSDKNFEIVDEDIIFNYKLDSDKFLPNHIKDHNYSSKRSIGVNIDIQYADDVSWLTTCHNKILDIEKDIEFKLRNRNLKLNKDKTEKYHINNNENDTDNWKKCKYVGTFLDTSEDLINRKKLAMFAFNNYKSKLINQKLSLKVRLRIFNVYITPIFLYNSELWTLTKLMENEIDIFHRILLRSILKIHYPYIISNDDLYSRTKEIPWSLIIKKRRFSWIGHMLRLPDEAPVKIALSECLESNRKKVGVGNKLTLIKAFNNQLIEVDNTLNLACETTKALAEDRGFWRKTAYGLAVVSTKDVNAEQ